MIKSQPVAKKNNKIYWQNGPNELDYGQIYSITITDGNYTANTFTNELTTRMNMVERKIATTTTEDRLYHNFQIVTDNITNTFTVRQNNTFNLNNPLSTVAGSSIVTVQQDQHDFLPGQVVNISGSTKVGGIPTFAINASQVIDVSISKVDSMLRGIDATTSAKVTIVLFETTSAQLTGKVNTEMAATW